MEEKTVFILQLVFCRDFWKGQIVQRANLLILLIKMILTSSEELHPKLNRQANICTSYHPNVNEKKLIFCLKIINLFLGISGKTSSFSGNSFQLLHVMLSGTAFTPCRAPLLVLCSAHRHISITTPSDLRIPRAQLRWTSWQALHLPSSWKDKPEAIPVIMLEVYNISKMCGWRGACESRRWCEGHFA